MFASNLVNEKLTFTKVKICLTWEVIDKGWDYKYRLDLINVLFILQCLEEVHKEYKMHFFVDEAKV